jgi:alpha-glutamyl/putrescinyl thymine pyrophosphorylase clade 1
VSLAKVEGITPELPVGRRILQTTTAFQSYLKLAAERQRIFFRRIQGEPPPWTGDPLLTNNRFTNAYRASDRVSQFLINEVIYGPPVDDRSTVLRVLLFKIFNRIDTWQLIEQKCGVITANNFDPVFLSELLGNHLASGGKLYSGAYIMPSPKFGSPRKHVNHLNLLQRLLIDGTVDKLIEAPSLRELYNRLSEINSFGPFLAYQFAIDLNYSSLYQFSEMDFVVAGPGARDGISKCFVDSGGVAPEDVIRAVAESAVSLFEIAGIEFLSLWGRPLQLIDCQNLFCETDKYSRVAHPELVGRSGRTQIKQRYLPRNEPLTVAYPPKWGLTCSSMSRVS